MGGLMHLIYHIYIYIYTIFFFKYKYIYTITGHIYNLLSLIVDNNDLRLCNR